MGAVIVDISGNALTVDPTSKAARIALYDANGFEVIRKPTLGSYLAFILVRQSTGTAAPGMVWSLFNSSLTTIMRVRSINTFQIFDGTSTTAGTTYSWWRTSGGPPTGGTAITPTKKRSADPASVADVRFLDTGLTQTALTRQGDPFARTNLSINSGTGVYSRYVYPKAVGLRRLSATIEIGPNQGIGAFLSLANAITGQGLCGHVEWDEVSL